MNINFQKAYLEIQSSSLHSLKKTLNHKALNYCFIRNEWYLMEQHERTLRDTDRTISHNAFIDAVNIMSRNMAKCREDNSWRPLLGKDRKVLGDFACYIVYMNGLAAR